MYIDEGSDVDADSLPKSMYSDMPTVVNFANTSERTVDVVWLDFNGRMVWYYTLEPTDSVEMQTYVTHPWVFIDKYSGARMRANRNMVYHPTPNNGNVPTVLIHIPVYKLKERCLQVVSKALHERTDAEKLDIPTTLKHDLLNYAPIQIEAQINIG
ncbi:protein Vhl-like [Tubulanus polymorphus]|uniref:protein Vhl-like n=1 Tax=Tubulanus polymorphus TaxID=672921 RepID=UPI003DA203CC